MVQSKRLNDGTWRNTIRPHVALATVKCLRLLGGDKLGSELPQLLKRVCDSLRSRDEQQRSSGHDAMVMMAAELGARHLLKILVALQNGLLAGYQVHVLSHTLHSILLRLSDTDEPETDSSERKTPTQDTEIKVNPAFESGLQACLPPILGILMEDVFGDAGAQKQEEHFKKKVKIKVRVSPSFSVIRCSVHCHCACSHRVHTCCHLYCFFLSRNQKVAGRTTPLSCWRRRFNFCPMHRCTCSWSPCCST